MKSKIFNRVKELITRLLKREESSIPTLSLRYPYSGSGARGIVVRDSYPSQEALSLTCEAQSSVCDTRTSLCEARECFTTKRIGSASVAHPLRKGEELSRLSLVHFSYIPRSSVNEIIRGKAL